MLYNRNSTENHLSLLLALSAISALALLLLAARISHTSSTAFSFLVWNLFLAWIPLLLALFSGIGGHSRTNTWFRRPFSFGLVLLWLLFLPNAPYILTDLIHLKRRAGVPFMLDVAMLFTFALNGLLLGNVSLYFWHRRWRRRGSRAGAWLVVGVVALLSSYGIYIGRTLRFNSWDALLRPVALGEILLGDLLSTERLPLLAGMVAGLSLIFLGSYWVTYALLEFHPNPRRRIVQGISDGPGRVHA